jgi:lipopolysaccharide export system protein LptC
MNKRQIIPFVALLAAFFLWVYIIPQIQTPAFIEHHPSYIADDVKSNHYDETGFNDYRIYADKMTSYPEDDIAIFEAPNITVFIKDKQTQAITVWKFSSVTGTLEKKNKLLLSDDVLIENLSKDQLVQKMLTNKAIIMLDHKEITSELKVTWTGPQVQQEGVGMWASMVTKEMKLYSNIKAVYLNEKK